MRLGITLFAMVTLLAASGACWARQADGFAGTAFGTSLASLPSFLTLKKSGDVTYAVNLNERYRVDGRAPVVFYGFAAGKLFAAYVRLDGIIAREAMAKRITAEYGKPSLSVEGGVEVLRWRKGDVKVKLKYDPATKGLKLAYYSIANAGPAASLPEPDSVNMDELMQTYEKTKISKGISLPAQPAPKGYSPYDDGVTNPTGRNARP
ncbi:hypothetical protein [Solidesulfovibrio sp.]|jgi:hypothetical protein|uniref:hypothetical protein n=1 Tax=Solidesulfovibrio sp. TaxID=2910990 RepID=UPI000EE26FCE|nr:hypothetical protein [Solidesulfovibrio sp.]MEA5087641.1 hypothetical protein [Solidesulfovibrio sp.]HCR13188.1 hypothetical protein [Desulfovibrio sp.]HML61226.1 hypothetical protein [Solidesulfovibrio sp.]